jgi:hypothetical protein
MNGLPGLPPPKPIPLKDRASIAFVEKGNVDVLDGAFVVVDTKGVRIQRTVVAPLTSTVYVSSHFIRLKRCEFSLLWAIRYRRQMATGFVQVLSEHSVR